jgi:hypothetical protein
VRTLARNFPKAQEGATCAVMRAMMERIMQHVRVLQLYGAGDCPDAKNVEAVADREMIELLKIVLSRRYTWDELKCFLPLQSLGKLGEWEPAFQGALDGYIPGLPPTPIDVK